MDGHKGPTFIKAKKTEDKQDANIGMPQGYHNAPRPKQPEPQNQQPATQGQPPNQRLAGTSILRQGAQ